MLAHIFEHICESKRGNPSPKKKSRKNQQISQEKATTKIRFTDFMKKFTHEKAKNHKQTNTLENQNKN